MPPVRSSPSRSRLAGREALMKRKVSIAVCTGLLASLAPFASAQSLPAWSTQPTTIPNRGSFQPAVVNLRVAEHPRFDRVVIDVKGRRPGVRANYTERLIYPGSGNSVALAGRR